jgi:hypothetical protein
MEKTYMLIETNHLKMFMDKTVYVHKNKPLPISSDFINQFIFQGNCFRRMLAATTSKSKWNQEWSVIFLSTHLAKCA